MILQQEQFKIFTPNFYIMQFYKTYYCETYFFEGFGTLYFFMSIKCGMLLILYVLLVNNIFLCVKGKRERQKVLFKHFYHKVDSKPTLEVNFFLCAMPKCVENINWITNENKNSIKNKMRFHIIFIYEQIW